MIADQIGPTGSEVTLTSTFGRIPQPAVSAKAQSVYHGPMIYTNDVYSLLDSAETDLDFHLLSIFAKSEDHSHQCEYRFAAWSNEKPALEHRILQASPRLLLAMEDRAEPTPAITIPPARAATHSEERPISSSPLKRRSRPGELFDSFDFGDNPARPTVPRKISKNRRAQGFPREDNRVFRRLGTDRQSYRNSGQPKGTSRRCSIPRGEIYPSAMCRIC